MSLMRVPMPREGFRIGVDTDPVAAHYVIADTEAELPATGRVGDQAYAKDTGKMFAHTGTAWVDVAGTATAGPHTHPIGDVTSLQAALDSKAASDHTHPASGSDPFTAKLVSLSGISTGANTTPVSVPNCSFDFVANAVYQLFLSALTQAAAATTGSGFQIDTSVAVSVVQIAFVHQLANTGTLTGGSSIADDASVGVSSGRPTANVSVPVFGMGVLVAGATPGTAQLRYRSEVAAVSSVLPGCVLTVLRVG